MTKSPNSISPNDFADVLIRLLAMHKLGQLQGLSFSAIDALGQRESAAYLAPGCPRLLMLQDQIRLLIDDM